MLRILLLALLFPAAMHAATPPFVGCPSDGQIGPQAAPSAPQGKLPDDPSGRLAWYEAPSGPGVLAPIGWKCFGLEGSSGSQLFVSPDPISAKDFFSENPKWKGLHGYGLQVVYSMGGTSGRYTVAQLVARVFPKYRNDLDHQIADGLASKSDFHFGPYPTDKLHYLSDHSVEFITPPHQKGLGTDSWLVSNAEPIHGFVQFDPGGDHDATAIYVRVPSAYGRLLPAILHSTDWPRTP